MYSGKITNPVKTWHGNRTNSGTSDQGYNRHVQIATKRWKVLRNIGFSTRMKRVSVWWDQALLELLFAGLENKCIWRNIKHLVFSYWKKENLKKRMRLASSTSEMKSELEQMYDASNSKCTNDSFNVSKRKTPRSSQITNSWAWPKMNSKTTKKFSQRLASLKNLGLHH